MPLNPAPFGRLRLALFLTAVAVAAEAQEAADPPPVPPAGAADAPPPADSGRAGGPEVDESALRYFAQQGDDRRLKAEIARLKALYPDWTPPEDPLALPAEADARLDAIWALLADGRLAEARRAIAERQADEPEWTPPADLVARLELAEVRQRLVNASDLRQHRTVIRLGAETPELLTCADVDVLWRLAEAFARTGRRERSEAAYRYVLANCDDPAERIATLQKASQLLERPAIERLLAEERPGVDGRPEFAAFRDELARAAVAEGAEDASVEVPEPARAHVEARFTEAGDPADALLLGWYHHRRQQLAPARDWFRKALGADGGAEAAQGLALVALADGNAAEAEAVAHPWRRASEGARDVYFAAAQQLLAVDPPADVAAATLERIVGAVAEARDAATAAQLGWYARALNQLETAEQWFAAALSWQADDEAAAFGLALTRHDLGRTAPLEELRRVWSTRSPRIAAVGEPAAAKSAAKAARAGSGATAGSAGSGGGRTCAAAGGVPSGPQAALARGWCLMDLNRPIEAARAFDAALRSGSDATRRDAAYGQSLAYLRAGLADEAAVAATRTPQTRARASELQAAILAERALTAFDRGEYRTALIALDRRRRIAPERIDLMVLRGYANLKLRRLGEAKRIFEAAAGTGSRDAFEGLSIVRGQK